MDGESFDALTRIVTAQPTRRGLLAGIGGGTLAGLIGGAGFMALMGDAAAKKKKKKKKKKAATCKGDSCGPGRLCVEGTCVTGAGTCDFGASICAATPFTGTCNGNAECFCFTAIGGATRCAKQAGTCGNCTDTEDCAGFGVGSRCVNGSDVASCPCDAGQNFCITPCPS